MLIFAARKVDCVPFVWDNASFPGLCFVLRKTVLARKKQSSSAPDPDYLKKRRASLRRTHRQVIYLNDKELAAVKEYCDRFGVKERSTIFREAAMERILAQLDDSHPTLF